MKIFPTNSVPSTPSNSHSLRQPMRVLTNIKKLLLVINLVFISPIATAATPTEQVISLKCSYAIAAIIGEMGTETTNLIMQDALSQIDENNGEFLCRDPGNGKIYVRLQSTEMSASDNKLVFTVNTLNYEIERTIYGR